AREGLGERRGGPLRPLGTPAGPLHQPVHQEPPAGIEHGRVDRSSAVVKAHHDLPTPTWHPVPPCVAERARHARRWRSLMAVGHGQRAQSRRRCSVVHTPRQNARVTGLARPRAMRERPGGRSLPGQACGWLLPPWGGTGYYAPTWRPAWGSRFRLRCGIGRRHAWWWLSLRKTGQAGTRRWLAAAASLALAATAALAGCGGSAPHPAAPAHSATPAATRPPPGAADWPCLNARERSQMFMLDGPGHDRLAALSIGTGHVAVI